MKKTIETNHATYNIKVTLNFLVDYNIGGERSHKVTVSSPHLVRPLEYITKDLEKELPLIEESLDGMVKALSDDIKVLKELGYNLE